MNKFRKIFSEAGPMLRQTAKRYPVELTLVVYAFLCSVFENEGLLTDARYAQLLWAMPIVLGVAYIANTLTRGGKRRWLYLLSWLLLLPAIAIGAEWFSTSQYVIAHSILVPLAMLLCRRTPENRRFVGQAMNFLAAGCTALLAAGIFFVAVFAIYSSIRYIFDIWGDAYSDAWAYDCFFSFILLAPTLFLALLDYFDRTDREVAGVGAALLNYLFTPALFVYTAILYLYTIRILITWELPKGGVANMVFGYTVALTVVMALQELLRERRYDGIFRRYTLLTAAPLGLFWVGTARRIAEYGLTDWRIYLIVCGTICTAAALLFLHPRTGRYRYLAVLSFVLFFAVAFFPPLSADRIGIRSQSRRAARIAREANMLLPDGKLDLALRSEADSVNVKTYYELGEALSYLQRKDTLALAPFGITQTSQYYDLFPSSYAYRVQYDWAYRVDEVEVIEDAAVTLCRDTDTPTGVEGYTALYTWVDQINQGDEETVRFAGRRIILDKKEVLDAQMERAGLKWEENPGEADFEKAKEQMLRYETDSACVLFRALSIDLEERRIRYMNVEGVLVR